MLILSVDYLFEAIKIIHPSDAFSKTEEKLAWQNALSAAESSMEILRIVLPFLTACSQWTQVLSQKAEVTVPLVSFACKSLKKQVLAIEKVSTDISMSITSRQILTDLVEELKINFSKYFSEEYLKFWIFEVGAFLDTRIYHTMPFANNDAYWKIFYLRLSQRTRTQNPQCSLEEIKGIFPTKNVLLQKNRCTSSRFYSTAKRMGCLQ
jgi:hypothetical protein